MKNEERQTLIELFADWYNLPSGLDTEKMAKYETLLNSCKYYLKDNKEDTQIKAIIKYLEGYGQMVKVFGPNYLNGILKGWD